jgi:hypothetical protein
MTRLNPRSIPGTERTRLLCAIALAAAAAGCTTTSGTQAVADPKAGDAISRIDLSTTRGETGRVFTSELTFEKNFAGEVETKVSGLPPGLAYDAQSKMITGKPIKEGFFTVQASVRKKIERGQFHKPKPDERWFVKRFEVSIYKPVGR